MKAIGLTDISEKYLIYFSTYSKTINDFYVSLENLIDDGDDHPYEQAGDFDHIDLKELEDLFCKHLRLTIDAQHHL